MGLLFYKTGEVVVGALYVSRSAVIGISFDLSLEVLLALMIDKTRMVGCHIAP